MTLRDELLELIRAGTSKWTWTCWATRFDHLGLIDSLALFKEQCGGPIYPATFDVRREWNTIEDVVAFVEHRRGA